MFIYNKPIEEVRNGFTGYMVDEASTIKNFDYENIYRCKEFNEAMKYFDISDDLTRGILLTVNEADQTAIMTSLSNKLYQHIVDKIEDIDFGTIPLSKGDITKIDNYEQLVDCINIISQILQEYKQPTESVEIIQEALQNLIDRTDLFTKAYKLNVEMPIIIYNTIALAIVSSVSYMITATIEFIKLPDDKGFDLALNKAAVIKAKDGILFTNLSKFNSSCAKGDFDKAMDYVIKQSTNQFIGALPATPSAIIIIGIILLIIPTIRELIFFFYYTRSKISDYFDAQSVLLTMNAYNIENNLTRDEATRKEIATKQRKIADTFRKISNTFKVNVKTAEQKATNDINKLDKQKYKSSDVLDRTPDSAASALF